MTQAPLPLVDTKRLYCPACKHTVPKLVLRLGRYVCPACVGKP